MNRSRWSWADAVFVLVLLAALAARLQLASTELYVHDEENTAIPLSRVISFEPGHVNLPLRGENHGALPAYVVKASGALFGTTPLGYRSLHVALGMATLLLIFLLVRPWYGPVAACWAVALMAFNEYYLGVSARATAHAPYLFLVASAVFAFSRFLRTERPAPLYVAGVCVGLAFYCKEHAALLLPLFFVTLLVRFRSWLRRPHAYLAAAAFALVIAPDVYWNATTNTDTARVAYNSSVSQASYLNHLKRIGGIGLSPYPTMFYAKDVVMAISRRVTGSELRDETPEYRSMNPALGALLVGAALLTWLRPSGHDALRTCLLLMFWGVFGFFTLIKRGSPPGRLDPVSWIWVESTLFPAVALAGAQLAGARGAWRVATWTFAAAALAYAVAIALRIPLPT
jgi:4-amino-4-deoxy-L-arabinose transferase-like glycosyltransferase